MKAPKSDIAQKILNDPRRAESLVAAILATRSRENHESAIVDGNLKVSMVGQIARIGRSQD